MLYAGLSGDGTEAFGGEATADGDGSYYTDRLALALPPLRMRERPG